MEIRQLSYFVKAAETLHFTEAAALLFVTQSTLSQQIKQLENELGMLLFDRIGKSVRLTEAGTVFLDHARKILLEIEKGKQAITDLNTSITGELKVGITYAFSSLILPVLSPFIEKNPGIKIFVEYDGPDELEKRLKLSELDFILSFKNDPVDKDLEMQPLFTSGIVVVVAKKHPLASLKKITLKEIGDLDLVLPGKGFISRNYLEDLFKKSRIAPKVKIELNDVHSLLTMVEAGNWITILNEKALIGWKNLVSIPIAGKDFTRKAFILWQKNVYRKKSAVMLVNEIFKVK